MKWIDGSELDLTQISGEELCQKLAIDMYQYNRDAWNCPDFIRNAMYIIDFDSEASMEGFAPPSIWNLTAEDYAGIIGAFRAIGDEADADILAETLRLDTQYQEKINSAEDADAQETLQNELLDQIDELETGLYLNTDSDMWSLLYSYLDAQKGIQ